MIKDGNSAVVTISSWHAQFSCDGKYTVSNEGEQLMLTWSSKGNTDKDCDMPFTANPPEQIPRRKRINSQ